MSLKPLGRLLVKFGNYLLNNPDEAIKIVNVARVVVKKVKK